MARTDNDTWDLASSVGATATMVAAARAVATAAPHAIIDDQFAAPLVRAVGLEFFVNLIDGTLNGQSTLNADAERDFQLETDSMAVRTRFFDEFFTDCSHTGISQSVILAAGLDSRPYRLPWAAGSTVYEVDQPQVIEFKTATMESLGAKPTAQRRTVSVDLRDDWPAALRESGFDPGKPAAWSAEGLLMYLPPDAQDRLFDNITALSAPGSRLATEYNPPTTESTSATNQRLDQIRAQWANLGCGIDLTDLFYDGDRSNVADYLKERGWEVSTRPRRGMFVDYGLTYPEADDAGQFRNILSLTATLGSA